MTVCTDTVAARRLALQPSSHRRRTIGDWLTQYDERLDLPLTMTQITTGRTNITWMVRDSVGRSWVLRERRRDNMRDFSREAAIVGALGPLGMPVARLVGHANPYRGAPFMVTAHVPGVTLHTREDAALLTSGQRRALGIAAVQLLAQLHKLDPAAVGLPHFPVGHIDRQLTSMTDLWTRAGSDCVHDSAWVAIRTRLLAQRPRRESRARLVHGDFRLENLIIDSEGVSAIVDWDWCTGGDPLADLAWMLTDWREPGEPDALGARPTLAGGFPTRGELLATYRDLTGLSLGDLPYHRAMAQWRAATLMQAQLTRQQVGVVDDRTPLLDVNVAGDAIAELLTGAADFMRESR